MKAKVEDPLDEFRRECDLAERLAAAIADNSENGHLSYRVNLAETIRAIYKDEAPDGSKGTVYCEPPEAEKRLGLACDSIRDLSEFDHRHFPTLESLMQRFINDRNAGMFFSKVSNGKALIQGIVGIVISSIILIPVIAFVGYRFFQWLLGF